MDSVSLSHRYVYISKLGFFLMSELPDMSLDLRQALSEEYSNSIKVSNREIYQKLRQDTLYPSSITKFAEKR
jgi:hypothetical protein